MSEPDAVPLPREGEVFFDVRGAARSMRLSWYADSAVAVFSIWQAGRCTGTFRLPFSDLARMVQTLTHGPRPEAGGTTRRARPAMTGQQSYDADRYQAGYRAAASEPATGAYRSADLPGYTGHNELPGYGNIPGYDVVPDYADVPGYSAAPSYDGALGYAAAPEYGPTPGSGPTPEYGPTPGSGLTPDHGAVPGSGLTPDHGAVPGYDPGPGYGIAADADGPSYSAAAAGDVPRHIDLPGNSGAPLYLDRPVCPDPPAYLDRPGAPDLASHPYHQADRVQADRVQADRVQATRALSAVPGQGEWLAAPASTSGWDSVMQEPSATPGLMSFPSVPARNGPAASDSGRASGY